MKRITTLILAASLVLGGVCDASAIDFKVKGEWLMNFDLGSGGKFVSKGRDGKNAVGNYRAAGHGVEDNFEARQRVRLELTAVASEALSGTVFFEMGDSVWGASNSLYGGGGALGADGSVVELKRAYIDWVVPSTDLKLRMGIQGFYLPSETFGSAILMEDGAGITASYKFNNNVSLTSFWLRPYNDNATATNTGDARVSANYLDNVDFFGLVMPLDFEGVKITPWVMAGAIGENFDRTNVNFATEIAGGSKVYNGASPIDFRRNTTALVAPPGALDDNARHLLRADAYSSAVWAGLTGKITLADPFRFSWDFNYGSVTTGREEYDRSGWMLSGLAEYKTEWGTPGLVGWWGSGDDGNIKNGSEIMPFVSIGSGGYNLSTLGTWGEPWLSNDGIMGYNAVGTWGFGARIMEFSFVEALKHNIRVNYFRGTNDPDMAGYITGTRSYKGQGKATGLSDFNSYGTYLTTEDSGMEVNLDTHYDIYKNLDMWVHLGYIHLWLDDSANMWGGYDKKGNSHGLNATDAWRASISFRYSF